MKILTVVGARPQFIKAAVVSREIAENTGIDEVIVHTGQHFDENMSDIFFSELDIPKPCYNLNISSLSHGSMTGRMLEKIEDLLLKERPDYVLVYGDTNSTLAGSLAAAKLGISVAHVESGLRSNNMNMPEEINRVLTDRLSNLLFCPTQRAVENLNKEGFPFLMANGKDQKIINVGDVMYDAMQFYTRKIGNNIDLAKWGVSEKEYILCTVHRQENTDNIENLKGILSALQDIVKNGMKVLLPLHPRTRNKINQLEGKGWLDGVNVIDPVGYLDMLRIQSGASFIMTDSGGVQKEAFFHNVPCITLREETEWVETVELRCNVLVGAVKERIVEAINQFEFNNINRKNVYGDGFSGRKIINFLR